MLMRKSTFNPLKKIIMKYFGYLIILLLGSSANLIAEFSQDAMVITLRHQTSIRLDYKLCNSIDSMLKSAVKLDTALKEVYALPKNTWYDLLIRPHDSSSWAKKLINGELVTGDKFIDSLNQVFHLKSVYDLQGGWIELKFDDTLQIDSLSKIYGKHPDVLWIQPNYIYTYDNYNDIDFLPNCGGNKFVFSKHPRNQFWYIEVSLINQLYMSKLIKIDTQSYGKLRLYLWNIPARYNASVFKTIDEMIDSLTNSSDWWVRKYTIETARMLFSSDDTWNGEDNSQIFNALKNVIEPRWKEFILLFQKHSTDDDCPYVRESAKNCFNSIKLPKSVKCISDTIQDSSGKISAKLFWEHQYRGVTNYSLQLHKLFDHEYKLILRDTTISDTSITIPDISIGDYSWWVEAKNEFGWSPYDYNDSWCNFKVTTSDVEQENFDYFFRISPNPASGSISITWNNNLIPLLQNLMISVFNYLGIEMKRIKAIEISGKNSLDISTEDFPSGIYFCSINSYTKNIIKSFVVVK